MLLFHICVRYSILDILLQSKQIIWTRFQRYQYLDFKIFTFNLYYYLFTKTWNSYAIIYENAEH